MPNGTTRSSSAPAIPRTHKRTEDDDGITEFPSFIQRDDAQDLGPGWWTRQILAPRSGRQSRASSIVSTRTRFSTTTLDEVRSIEINAGGNTYRISRDGSQITDLSAPPPYTGHSPEYADSIDDVVSQHYELSEDNQENIAPEQEPRKRVRIVLPGESDDDRQESGSPDHVLPADKILTKADLYQLVLDLPFLLKQALGMKASGSSGLIRSNTFSPSSSPGGVQESEDMIYSARYIHGVGREAGPHSGHDILLTSSPLSELANPASSSRSDGMEVESLRKPEAMAEARSSTDTVRPAVDMVGDQTVHMTVGDLNELSLLYNGVIRDLDREHRRKLHERDKEMERLRSLLNEKDIIYRQQMKAKDFIIEDQRAQLARQEDTIERKLELARNEVEDDWEKRWKVQEARLMERFTKAEENAAKHKQADRREQGAILSESSVIL